MICKECGIVLPWDGAKEISACTICRKPFSTTVDDVFRDGKFSICKERREGQHKLALDIEEVISLNRILLAEGGTGIGKSYGYLVPGILSGRRMVVATAKKTLQNQLYDKDLPTLREKMVYVPYNYNAELEDAIRTNDFESFEENVVESIDEDTHNKFNFVNIKGKSNYLCPDLLIHFITKTPQFAHLRKKLIERVTQIMTGVAHGKSHAWIERADFPELADHFFDLSLENCPSPGACRTRCKPRPKEYNIIVTNHHVLAYQLRYGERVLGKVDVLIVDEAHHFEGAIRSAYTDTLGVNLFKKPLRVLREDEDLRDMIAEVANASPEKAIVSIRQLQDSLIEIASYAREYMDSGSKVVDQEKLRSVLSGKLADCDSNIRDAIADVSGITERLSRGEYTVGMFTREHIRHNVGKMMKVVKRLDNMMTMTKQLRSPDPEQQFVLLYEEKNGEPYLVRAPIDVGPLVNFALSQIPVKVFVSATLAVNKRFDYFKKRVGLDLPIPRPLPDSRLAYVTPTPTPADLPPPETKDAFYVSPFDYNRQARLYTPRYTYNEPIPNPSDQVNHEQWLKCISMEILRLCRYSEGDAFVLFTAKTDLRDVKAKTEKHFEQYGLTLLAQQEEGAEELLEKYRKTPKSVLFGLKSFWEGVDIVGEKLRLVIIPKLPFPNQSDAVIKELVKRAGKSWFNEVYVPKMIFDLRQGTGRLIRSMTDKGVVAILDTRIWTATSNPEAHATNWERLERKVANGKPYGPSGYGKMIVNSLGFENVVDNFFTAVNFLNEPLTSVNGS